MMILLRSSQCAGCTIARNVCQRVVWSILLQQTEWILHVPDQYPPYNSETNLPNIYGELHCLYLLFYKIWSIYYWFWYIFVTIFNIWCIIYQIPKI